MGLIVFQVVGVVMVEQGCGVEDTLRNRTASVAVPSIRVAVPMTLTVPVVSKVWYREDSIGTRLLL